jgi:hypothetical protein
MTTECQGGGAAHAGNGGLAVSSDKTKTPYCPITKSYGSYNTLDISEGSGGGSAGGNSSSE